MELQNFNTGETELGTICDTKQKKVEKTRSMKMNKASLKKTTKTKECEINIK